MQGLGGVRLKQGRLDESFEAYQKALANFKITSGPRYFRTGQVLMKLGEHYALRRQWPEAK
jgi:tetratricopeptide (TPR) repeat protein